jgi:hypothetical protein
MLFILALIVASMFAVQSYAKQARDTAIIAVAQQRTEHVVRQLAIALASLPRSLAYRAQARAAATARVSPWHASRAYLVGAAMSRVDRANVATVHATCITSEFQGVQ